MQDRLKRIPSARIVFVCGNADISFCPDNFTLKILEHIVDHNKRAPHKTYYFQSKRPAYCEPFLSKFPDNVILLTTLETNRDERLLFHFEGALSGTIVIGSFGLSTIHAK
jgi:protein gp37